VTDDIYAVLVTGSRNYTNKEKIRDVLNKYFSNTVLIVGGATGADTIAADIAERWEWNIIEMLAQWARDGKAAGPIRNQEMLKVLGALGKCGYKTVVEAFPHSDSRGTRHMISRAREAGVTVNIHEQSE